jgi:hypothetical protein
MLRRTRTPFPVLLVAFAALGAGIAALPADAAPARPGAGYEASDEYPDASTGAESAGAELVRGGQDEDANWVPFLGDHELWCTNGNPGYSGCAGHHGYPALDIGMPVGTKVYAAGPGTVRAAGSSGDARGTYVEIQHPDGVRSRYYHLSATLVHQGQHVERGTLIARSGMTGRTTSPHLHYEERTANGGQKDPGVMFGIFRGRLLVYPNSSGHTSWWQTPYGTRIRNQSFAVDNTSLYWGGPGVATGDLNGDGAGDVVAGIPGEDTGQTIDSGGAFVLYGTARPARAAWAGEVASVMQGSGGVPGQRASNEVFGAAVATGDFDGDGFDDLAVGAPAATVQNKRAAGEVVVLRGSAEGVIPAHGARIVRGKVIESGDQFGASLTTGDFDGDGDDELVVGSPGEGIAGLPVAGAVTVFDGSPDGLSPTPREIVASTTNVAGDAEAGDRLGVAVAAGDTNGDGVDDLAVGIPGEDTVDPSRHAEGDAGAVLVLLGRSVEGPRPGLRGDGSVEIHADTRLVVGDGRAGDQLGISVAVGDVQGDRFADVIAGAVGRDVGRAADAGALLVLRGSATGIRPAGSRQITLDTRGVAGTAGPGDRLGSSLAIGTLDDNGAADLLVGVAGKAVNRQGRAGAVLVLRGGGNGLAGAGSRLLHAGTATSGLADKAEAVDVLGAAVALGDLDQNGYDDLVIGAPGEDVAGAVDGGAVTVVANTEGGLDVAGSRLVHGSNVGDPDSEAEKGDRWGGLFPIYLK